MNCLTTWPVEIVILLLQVIEDDMELLSLLKGIPELLSIELVKEYYCLRIHHKLCLKEDDKLIGSNWGELKYFTQLTIGNKLKMIKKDIKLGIGNMLITSTFKDFNQMERLKVLHVEHNDGYLIGGIINNMPKSLVVFELVINDAIKGTVTNTQILEQQRLIRSREAVGGSSALNLKMITIINKSKWNQRQVYRSFGVTNKKVAKLVNEGLRVEQLIMINGEYVLKKVNSKLTYIKTTIINMIKGCNGSVQNIGIFGIDVNWIFNEEFANTKFPEIRIVKVDGNSIPRMIRWVNYFFVNNCPTGRIEYKNGIMVKPMVVVFSKMFGDNHCKVLYGHINKVVVIGGNGVDMFKKYTFV